MGTWHKIEKSLLEELYICRQMTIREIAKYLEHTTTKSVVRHIKKFDINGAWSRTFDKDKLADLNKAYSKKEIATMYKCLEEVVYLHFNKYNIIPSTKKERNEFWGGKICACCREFRLLDQYSKNTDRSDGLDKYCKKCVSDKSLSWRAKIKQHPKKIVSQNTCIKCGKTKDINEFEKHSMSKTGYSNYCKECVNEMHRKRWNDSGELQQMTKNNKRKRRELSLALDYNYSVQHEKITREAFDNKCFRCGSNEKLCIDHHYPLSSGHGLSLTNAVLLCCPCNLSKSAKMPEDFYTDEELERLNEVFEQFGEEHCLENKPKRRFRYGKRQPLDKEKLYNFYIVEEMSSNQIAKKIGCSKRTVLVYLHKYNIPVRTVGRKNK